MPGIYLWTALQLHKTFSRKEDRMAEMNGRSSVKPETSPSTRAQLAIADVAGVGRGGPYSSVACGVEVCVPQRRASLLQSDIRKAKSDRCFGVKVTLFSHSQSSQITWNLASSSEESSASATRIEFPLSQ